MRTRRTLIGLIVLTLLVGILGHRLWSRGTGLRLGARASTLSGPHPTEAQWAAAQVIGDLSEMLLYARDAATKPGAVEVTVTRVDARLQARAVLAGRTIDLDVDAREGVWSAETYRPIVERLVRELVLRPAAPASGPPDPTTVRFTARLLDADAPALERESERLGTMLGADMLRAELHDAAAFLVMAFSLRESAGRLSDDRPQLLRMLAHLAIAAALRGDEPPPWLGAAPAGYAVFLAGRGRDAWRAFERLGSGAQGTDAAWLRVLTTRIDEDWRRLANGPSLVERLEYFRARMRTVGTSLVFAEIDTLRVGGQAGEATDPDGGEADWGRIVSQDFLRVDGAEYVTNGLARELGEVGAVWRVTHGGTMPANLVGSLDTGRIGALTPRGPRPLSWGLWSRFFERHLVTHAVQVDALYRHSWSRSETAESVGAALDARLGSLDLYPAATGFRTRGVANGDADLRLIDSAIRVTLRRPEIVPAAVWAWLEYGQQYEPVAKGMPSGVAWFARPVPRLAAVDLWRRLDGIGHKLTADDLEALWRESPADFRLAEINMERRFLNGRTADAVRQLFGARFDYDLRVRRHAGKTLEAPRDRVAVERGNCALDLEACFALARTLVDAGEEAEAVREYERVLADERVGAVAKSNNVNWLTNYYREHDRVDRALALANQAAEVGSGRGLYARAWLFERLDRLDEAEADYVDLANRYDQPYYAVSFFYRMARVRKVARFEPRLQEWLPGVFPSGLQSLGPADARQAPPRAVQVMKDSPLSRKYGIRAGDLIVGVDGWRVENLDQYYAIQGFASGDQMRFVLWRGVRVDTEATTKDRWLSVELRSYPVHGWAE